MPETFARTFPVEMDASPIVPVVVIGPPVTPLFVATLVTVPVPVTVVQLGFAAAPAVVRTWPAVPGLRAAQTVPDRYRTCPWVPPITLSMIEVREFPNGVAVPPEIFESRDPLPMLGSWASVALPPMSENIGCVALGTPDVEMVLIHFEATAARLSTPPNVEDDGFGNCAPVATPEMSVKAG
jgi:hypothetical protein